MAGVLFVSYVLGVLIIQPETPVSVNGMLTKLSGESAFTVMSLLGANIMPHNLYLHSSIIRVLLSASCTWILVCLCLRKCIFASSCLPLEWDYFRLMGAPFRTWTDLVPDMYVWLFCLVWAIEFENAVWKGLPFGYPAANDMWHSLLFTMVFFISCYKLCDLSQWYRFV